MEVAGELLNVQRNSEILGRALKLSALTVASIQVQYRSPRDRLFHTIDVFLKQVEPPPTWRVILEALMNPLIGEARLAQVIEMKYCSLLPTDEGNVPLSL